MYYQQESTPERRKQSRKKRNCIIELIIVFVMLGILVALIHSALQQSSSIARLSNNDENARIIGGALAMYSDDHDSHLPLSANWAVALQPSVDEYMESRYQDEVKRVKQLKLEGEDPYTPTRQHFDIVKWSRDPFAMNRALSGINLKAIKHAEQTVAFFETTERKPNPSGDQRTQLSPYGERKCNIFVMADGSVKISEHAKDGSIRLVDRHGKPVTIRWEP